MTRRSPVGSPVSVDRDPWLPFQPSELRARLAHIARPWCVVGGWALDLWHGHVTRDHADIEFAILREDEPAFRDALHGLEFYRAHDGVLAPIVEEGPLPDGTRQIWCRDPAERCWRVDMMLEPGTPEIWVYRRAPQIRRPRTEMVATGANLVPYLKPAGVLLFKAKHPTDKDEQDFARAAPKLPPPERTWLKRALDIAHPGHDWAQML